MLTPAFEIIQDDLFITVIIKAPFARVTDTEIFIEENEFRFHSKPYFLRLTLPGNILEDGREEAKYDTDTGSFTVKVPKETKGEHFEGLDMITKLLTSKGQPSAKSPMIEVLSETTTDTTEICEEQEDEDYDWHIEQTPFTDEQLCVDGPKYGFANQKSGLFSRLQDEVVEIVDLKNPDQYHMKDRRELRLSAEEDKFDEDHYLADLYEDDAIQELLLYNCWLGSDSAEGFTDPENEMMRNLPKKEYLIDNKVSVFLGLVDIIFAYCYDIRTTEGEHNVESSWTISKLSSTLSWLDTFTSLEETLVACYRRCLCYPLYRNWELTVRVHQDAAHVFICGREQLLKCLLDIHKCFSENYPRYLLNDLYITDYCVWIQSADQKQLQSLAEAINKCVINKADVGLDLCSVEAAVLTDEIDNVTRAVANVNIYEHNSEDCSTDTYFTETSSESEDESTDSVTSTCNTENDENMPENDYKIKNKISNLPNEPSGITYKYNSSGTSSETDDESTDYVTSITGNDKEIQENDCKMKSSNMLTDEASTCSLKYNSSENMGNEKPASDKKSDSE